MQGGDGGDTYVVDNIGDLILEFFIPEYDNVVNPPDIVLSYVNFSLSPYLENLTLMGTANLSGTGSDSNNIIQGNSGANTIDGSGGNDWLYGNAGNDILVGGTGSDTLDGGAGVDNMAGGLGNDLYIVENATDITTESAGAGRRRQRHLPVQLRTQRRDEPG
jgi:Ca2+-binding RTX toxin-like protein